MVLQKDINPSMRTILVDWLIEVQENFELFHETLYLSVKLTDRYLSRKDVKREYLQLVAFQGSRLEDCYCYEML